MEKQYSSPEFGSRARFRISMLFTALLRRTSIRFLIAIILVVFLVRFSAPEASQDYLERASSRFKNAPADEPFVYKPTNASLHFVMTATQGNVDLCKTLLATSILGYPSPTLLGWGEELGGGIGGGTHMLKISRTLEYLESLGEDQQDDVVLAVDAYDVHFQLSVEVLMERFYRINHEHNLRLKKELGAAYDIENIRQTIVFGAGKKCWPNDRWEIACWTVPPSPAPDDLYGNNTDTIVGRTDFYSSKQRWVNSGYIIGTVGSLRKLFTDAKSMMDAHKNKPMHSGSDQAVWLLLYGFQNYMRETARLKHLSSWERYWHPERAKPKSIEVQGLKIDNILSPSVSHQAWTPKEGKNYEYGMGLDFYSDIGHQTMNSNIGQDTQWVVNKHPNGLDFESQVNARNPRDTVQGKGGQKMLLDCPIHLPKKLPADVRGQDAPFKLLQQQGDEQHFRQRWEDVPLYAHLCFGTYPVIAHHNGNKENREFTWPEMWYYPFGKELMDAAARRKGPADSIDDYEEFKKRPGRKEAGGSWTDRGKWIEWQTMCPLKEMSQQLYGKSY